MVLWPLVSSSSQRGLHISIPLVFSSTLALCLPPTWCFLFHPLQDPPSTYDDYCQWDPPICWTNQGACMGLTSSLHRLTLVQFVPHVELLTAGEGPVWLFFFCLPLEPFSLTGLPCIISEDTLSFTVNWYTKAGWYPWKASPFSEEKDRGMDKMGGVKGKELGGKEGGKTVVWMWS